MVYSHISSQKSYSIFIVLFIIIFIINISSCLASDSNIDETNTAEHAYITNIDPAVPVTDFEQFYDSITNDTSLTSRTIQVNGKENTMVELPGDSVAIKLPGDEERIGLRTEATTSLCPSGSTLYYSEDATYIKMPAAAVPSVDKAPSYLKISQVITLPVENFTTSTTIEQSINKLNSYHVNIAFTELNNAMLRDYTYSYSIDWGDGNTASYSIEETTASHTYYGSGRYPLIITLTDDFGQTYLFQETLTVNYEGPVLHTYFLIEANKEPLAVTTSAGLSLFTIGLIAFTETGKYKFLAILALLFPMYMHLTKEDVLDQFVRGQIYGYIKTNPGVHYNQIRRGIGVKNGTLSYHLRVLEKTELIKSRRERLKYRAFYPTGMQFPKKERFRLTDFQLQILDIINENKGIHQKDIARKLEKKPQTINYNIKVLDQAGLIEVVKKGRKTYCYPLESNDLSSQVAE